MVFLNSSLSLTLYFMWRIKCGITKNLRDTVPLLLYDTVYLCCFKSSICLSYSLISLLKLLISVTYPELLDFSFLALSLTALRFSFSSSNLSLISWSFLSISSFSLVCSSERLSRLRNLSIIFLGTLIGFEPFWVTVWTSWFASSTPALACLLISSGVRPVTFCNSSGDNLLCSSLFIYYHSSFLIISRITSFTSFHSLGGIVSNS